MQKLVGIGKDKIVSEQRIVMKKKASNQLSCSCRTGNWHVENKIFGRKGNYGR